ncbi:iron dependent repressor, metal binding and dimerization domain protein [Corynebacterium frankenforstense]|uniref:metal-dependent transcriptional regulator n=1 Tax=Corynebacterium frankenforstense TaxID=1230998 RepID=UPI00254BB73F|nr:metal-dependent transcriptional regulator [Corynebacterium frankenforstense]MDK6260332.1 iron dependent repressor, metal binding and dimerization domain protein [Corynebacterium frankenforstense]
MRDLVDTTEMYLRTIYELEEEGITPLRARIVERLEQSGPTVSQTVARMERDGLLHVRQDRSLEMTEEGRARAISVMRKHRLAEQLLTDVLDLDIHQVHEEACRWEHVMSDEVERRVIAVLDDPTLSPFGNPVPGLEELGTKGPEPLERGVRPVDLPEGETVHVRLLQINEILQVDVRQFRALTEIGAVVGAEIDVTNIAGTVTVAHDGQSVELADYLGHALRVERIDE